MRAVILGFFMLAGVSGCATSPIPTRAAQTVPADHIYRIEQIPREGNAQAGETQPILLGDGGARPYRI